MTLQFLESFEYLNALADKYTGNYLDTAYNIISTTYARSGTRSLKCYWTDRDLNIDIPTPATEMYIGLAVLHSTSYLDNSNRAFIQLLGDNGYANLSIRRDILTRWTLRDATDSIIHTTPAKVMGAWYFIEIKIKPSNSSSSGDVIFKINEEEVYSCGAGVDFLHASNSGTTTNTLKILGDSVYVVKYIDDIYICDSAGSVNNTFLGDSAIDVLYPDGNGNANQFTGSDADSTDNYLHVDEAQADDDTSYVESSTSSHLDQYTFDNLASTPSLINGVIASTYAKKDDAGSRTGRLVCRRSSTNYEGSSFNPSTDYLYFDEVWEQDPSTAAAWTESNLNAAEFGIKVQS
jgi:hypothetical protein